MSNNKFVCIHGHFYQPPRENPWLNKVEIQESAYPYHDWNHRITAECYARNSASRILNGEGRILDIINNYSRISFNFGPTLLQWMEIEAPDIYQAILQADKDSQQRFSGHGSALAQAYNHMIMPLANERDKETQVIWGIRDFEARFGRKPEGMWVGETAVNTETLEVLARHDIKFTILSPYQAKRVRKIGQKEWKDATNAKINPRNSYVCNLPSGKTISLFFYDGPVSQGIAFEGLLNNGEAFANRLIAQLLDDNTPQLMNIATDGESYGHHHRFGEMGLSYCLHHIEENELARLSIYGEYLEKFPPDYEVEILENTSWSCAHGVERWSSDCGCHTGGRHDWNQKWRKPFREALDWVREETVMLYEKMMLPYTDDPWGIRNKYITVILDRSPENVARFLGDNFNHHLTSSEKIQLLKLLEMQYHAMLMYTSCGWFFDEITGIESMQDIFYAARAIQLAGELGQRKYEEDFLKLLEKAPSNLPEYGNAANAYNKIVRTTIVDLWRVGAHYAVSSLFEDYPKVIKINSFTVESQQYEYYEAGKQKLAIGRVKLHSNITWEESEMSFAVLHLGEHHLFGGVRNYNNEEAFHEMHHGIAEAFQKSKVYEIFNLMDKHFGMHNYSFWHLFRDDQRKIMQQVMENTLQNVESTFYHLYENSYPILQVLNEMNMTVPRQLKMPVDFTVNTKLTHVLNAETIDLEELKKVLNEVKRISAELDIVTLNFITSKRISELMEQLVKAPDNMELLTYIINMLRLINNSDIKPEYWRAQNLAYMIKLANYDTYNQKCEIRDGEHESWCKSFDELYKNFNLVLDPVEV